MEDIMRLAMSEAMLFKYGSGTGTDLSSLRSTREKLSGGGKPSGPLSFLKVYDQIANVVKSGGKTRRAAKMNTLKDTHPDIEEFIDAKQNEERKAWALIEQGYDGSYNGDAYGSVMYQNENLSVRVSDEFMDAAVEDREWWTRRVRDGQPCEQKDARTLLRKIAEGTHVCGDPGMQFDTTIHKWHTCKGTGRQNSTNPCSEYLFLDIAGEKNVTIFGLHRVIYRLHVVFPLIGEPHMLLCAYSQLIGSAIHPNSPLFPTLTRYPSP